MLDIGVIGCGMVSHAYLGTIARSPDVRLRSLASRTMASAGLQAARYGGQAVTIDALLADPAIGLVVNLAPPAVHHAIGRRVLEAGKHLYSEKPFATTMADAIDLLDLADRRGARIGCAPDTFLAPGHQAARRLIDEGAIGQVTGGAIAFGSRGMESWHPAPASFYATGGGPLLDIGPYYVTQLVNLLGPVAAVIGFGSTPRAVRQASAPGRAGAPIAVEVPTSIAGALLFASGANVSLALSWDVAAHSRPAIELYGECGTLTNPDPNGFGGAVRLTADGAEWTTIGEQQPRPRLSSSALAKGVAALMRGIDPLTGGPVGPQTALGLGDLRGLGVLDLADAILRDRAPRASGALAVHVLETLLAIESSIAKGCRVEIASRVARPEPVPA